MALLRFVVTSPNHHLPQQNKQPQSQCKPQRPHPSCFVPHLTSFTHRHAHVRVRHDGFPQHAEQHGFQAIHRPGVADVDVPGAVPCKKLRTAQPPRVHDWNGHTTQARRADVILPYTHHLPRCSVLSLQCCLHVRHELGRHHHVQQVGVVKRELAPQAVAHIMGSPTLSLGHMGASFRMTSAHTNAPTTPKHANAQPKHARTRSE